MWLKDKGGTKSRWIKDDIEKRNDEKSRETRRAKFNATWITGWRLKKNRLWTDGAIKSWLGKPTNFDGYKMYPLDKVVKIECTKEFQAWFKPRLVKKIKNDPYFEIEPIDTK
jgi:hypothetical protein